MSSPESPRACPLLFTIGLVVHGVGAAGLTVAFAVAFVSNREHGGDPLWIASAVAAPLCVFAFSCVVAWGLRRRRRWAGWLALARSVLVLVNAVPLVVVMVFAVILPYLLLIPWSIAVLGEALLFFGGIVAFVKSLRYLGSRSGQPATVSPTGEINVAPGEFDRGQEENR
jgi:hypothetical protein